MKTRLLAFNIYLCGLALLSLGSGCLGNLPLSTKTKYVSDESDPQKQLTMLRLHGESNPDPTGRTVAVPILRSQPMMATIDREAFLSEDNVLSAEVVDEPAGFSVQVTFDRRGEWLLEQASVRLQGRRIVVFAKFGPERWLGAPVVHGVLADGKFKFMPDATREEADRITRGLRNYARQAKHTPES
jgi:hypothetical protein